MKVHKQNDPLDTLGAVYEKIYEYIAVDFHQLKEKSSPEINKLISNAKQKVIQLEAVSEHEAAQLTEWLKRDMDDLASYLTETQNELKDWLGFETALLENAVLDLLLKTADSTTVELLKLKEEALQPYTYRTGEITIAGTLICDNCGDKLHFYKAGKIPPCPKCHKVVYHREWLS